MAKFSRVLVAIAAIGFSAATASPSNAAPEGHSVAWASLGVVRPTLTQPAGWGSPIAAQPGSATLGWCSQRGVEVASASGRVDLVPDRAVGVLLEDSHLGIIGSPGGSKIVVTCDAVALDPNFPHTVYAGFEASEGGSIPPIFNVALVTTNSGKSWHYVPPPRGDSNTDFAGFVEWTRGIEVLYSRNIFFPPKPAQFTEFTAATSTTGGRTWMHRSLDCTGVTQCVIFGPQASQGACGMSEWQQSVLVGEPENLTGAYVWRPAGADSTVSQCGAQQLIATASKGEFLIDRQRPSALFYTHDGVHWTSVLLPKIAGVSVGGSDANFGQVMTLAANGDLIAVAGSPLQTNEHLELLKPGSSTWCAANATLPSATKQDPVVAIQSGQTKLAVAFFATGGAKETTAVTFPLSTLSCK